MKRLHIHVGVEKLDESVCFYSTLFGAEPAKLKPDYAKWVLEDPFVNFAISTRTASKGVDHLGIQVDEDRELGELRERLKAADMAVFDEGETVCCYARSDKTWVQDPAGIPWEAYQTMDDAQLYSGKATGSQSGCCLAETTERTENGESSKDRAGCCDAA